LHLQSSEPIRVSISVTDTILDLCSGLGSAAALHGGTAYFHVSVCSWFFHEGKAMKLSRPDFEDFLIIILCVSMAVFLIVFNSSEGHLIGFN
jgi:hypothetical protein